MADQANEILSESEHKLFEFINEGKIGEVQSLLGEPDVHIDCLDKNGMSPLQHAAYKGCTELCRLFLARGADVNSEHHEHGYTALMFAAISGNTEITQMMLAAGGKVDKENSVGRTAAQMAGFTGQHQCVSLINNFFSLEELEYFCTPRGLETEPKLPPSLAAPIHGLILLTNLNPVKLSLYMRDHPELLSAGATVVRVLELLVDRVMKRKFTNEVLAMKFYYIAAVVKQCNKSQEETGSLNTWIKSLLRGRESDGFEEGPERLVRNMLREYPYSESQILQQMIRAIAPVKIGGNPSGLSVLSSGINGQRFASEDDKPCSTCGDLGAVQKCSVCKMVNYCHKPCQKLHWFTHKKFCKQLAELHEIHQQQMKLKEEQDKEKERIEQENKEKESEQENKDKEPEDKDVPTKDNKSCSIENENKSCSIENESSDPQVNGVNGTETTGQVDESLETLKLQESQQ